MIDVKQNPEVLLDIEIGSHVMYEHTELIVQEIRVRDTDMIYLINADSQIEQFQQDAERARQGASIAPMTRDYNIKYMRIGTMNNYAVAERAYFVQAIKDDVVSIRF